VATNVRSIKDAALVTAALVALLGACNALVGAPLPVPLPADGAPPEEGGMRADGSLDAETSAPSDAPASVDAGIDAIAVDSSEGGTDAPTVDGPDAATGPVVLVHDAHLGDIDTLAVWAGVLYGTSNGSDPASGPAWSVSTAGAGFRYISPYNALINGVGAVRQMALDPPVAYLAVAAVSGNSSTWGAWKIALDGSSTSQLFGFYNGVILAADPPGKPNVYISDARNPGWSGEPKAGDVAPNNQIACNAWPAEYPAPMQIVTDASGNLFWAYNGASIYGTSPPIVRQILQATPATVGTWTHQTPCNGYLTLVTDVDVQGIAVDGTNVYWSETGPSAAIRAIPYGGLGSSRIVWSSPGYPVAERPRALQTDGRYVYWVAGTEYVWAVAVDGSTQGWPVAVVGPAAGRTRITAMTFDDSFVYFADSGTYSIWKVAKPR
jgi:hypothetical protein